MRVIRLSVSVALAALSLTAARPALAAADGKAETIAVDAAESKVYWLGKKITGQHNGAVDVSGGELIARDGQLAGGTITIDMPTISVDDLKDPDYNAKLTGHLKSADFFDIENHPEATYRITGVKPIAKAKAGEPNATVAGELTVKGITKPLGFPARIDWEGETLTATAKDVRVDRTLYNVRYGSGKFFENLGDKTIHDDFWIDFKIVGARK